MLQNASCASKTKQNNNEKNKKVPPSWSQTQDLRHVRATHYPLHNATKVYVKLIVFNIVVPTRYIIQDGAENAVVWRNEYHKRSPLSTTGIPIVCVVFSQRWTQQTIVKIKLSPLDIQAHYSPMWYLMWDLMQPLVRNSLPQYSHLYCLTCTWIALWMLSSPAVLKPFWHSYINSNKNKNKK